MVARVSRSKLVLCLFAAGCSAAYIQAQPDPWPRPGRSVVCDTSTMKATGDFVAAAAMGAAAVALLATWPGLRCFTDRCVGFEGLESLEHFFGATLAGTASVMFAISGVAGHQWASRCSDLMTLESRCRAGDDKACGDLYGNPQTAPRASLLDAHPTAH